MRIAGDTIRRNYLSRYETNYGDKYNSEKKIYSGRQFDRASENPIDAARALRLRKSMAEVETYQDNLKTADSIYTNAETSLMSLSTILQTTYEKLVEGADGTRNPDDMNIIAMSIDNYAEEMVQSLNIDIADRKVFGGLNNETAAFKIEGSENGKYLTYNGVSVNSSNDPDSFPYSGVSYLDIGIGMSTDKTNGRIDDQSALPITFNGVQCTGCGMTNKTASIELNSITPGNEYSMDISAGGKARTIKFIGGNTNAETVENINAQLKEAFQETPEITEDGQFHYIDDPTWYPYKNAAIDDTTGSIDFSAMTGNEYYSLEVTMNGKTKYVDFRGGDTVTDSMNNLTSALNDAFGEGKFEVHANGMIIDAGKQPAQVSNYGDYGDVNATADGGVDIQGAMDSSSADPSKIYAVNLGGKKVVMDMGGTVAETVEKTNKRMAGSGAFGETPVPRVNDLGTIQYDVDGGHVVIDNTKGASNEFEFNEVDGYAKNIIQLVLDAGKMLRKGDHQMVARYADLIYAAQSNLSIAIADLGTHSKFIEFNEDRLADVMINLKDKQNDIESTDLPSEITRWKVLESVYNASLQMGSSVLSQSIFNYIN
jgi:flagellar hook-associated protein 3 FlgL